MKAAFVPEFTTRLKQKDCVAQIKLMDGSVGRHFIFADGVVKSKRGLYTNLDISMNFSSAKVALELLIPPYDNLARINAAKMASQFTGSLLVIFRCLNSGIYSCSFS